MGIGTSIVVLAVGAVLAFAVTADVSGISLGAVGIILMIAGVVGIILMIAGAVGLVVSLIARHRHTEEHVVHERGHRV